MPMGWTARSGFKGCWVREDLFFQQVAARSRGFAHDVIAGHHHHVESVIQERAFR
jgi:hypothetical protein